MNDVELLEEADYGFCISNGSEELKKKSDAELAQELTDAKKELFNLRFQNATNQLENTARMKEVKKNIARIQTLITEKQMAR